MFWRLSQFCEIFVYWRIISVLKCRLSTRLYQGLLDWLFQEGIVSVFQVSYSRRHHYGVIKIHAWLKFNIANQTHNRQRACPPLYLSDLVTSAVGHFQKNALHFERKVKIVSKFIKRLLTNADVIYSNK